MSDEVSPGGSSIFRHEPRDRVLEPTGGDPELIDAVSKHLERVLGPDGAIFHEVVSDLVHIDVHMVAPTPERDWITLVTSGMAERPMAVPEGLEEFQYAELVLALPSDWPLDQDSLDDEANYWPLRLLKDLARLPHEHETFLYYGHTIPNGDPPKPYVDEEPFCGAFIANPRLMPEGSDELALPDGRTVYLYAVYPLHEEEMDFKLERGAEALWERFAEHEVSEWVWLSRPSVV